MERSWRKTKLEVFRIAWRENTFSYRKALKTARSDYFSSLLEENKHNPQYLFNTVAKLTKNKASTGVDISQQHSSKDFMNYFTSNIDIIKPLSHCTCLLCERKHVSGLIPGSILGWGPSNIAGFSPGTSAV